MHLVPGIEHPGGARVCPPLGTTLLLQIHIPLLLVQARRPQEPLHTTYFWTLRACTSHASVQHATSPSDCRDSAMHQSMQRSLSTPQSQRTQCNSHSMRESRIHKHQLQERMSGHTRDTARGMRTPLQELVLYPSLPSVHHHWKQHHHEQQQLGGMALKAGVQCFSHNCQSGCACDHHKAAADPCRNHA